MVSGKDNNLGSEFQKRKTTYPGAIMSGMITENIPVSTGGQITLSSNILACLGAGEGTDLTFVCEGNRVIIMNSALYTMKELQEGMRGKAERAGLRSEEDVDAWLEDKRSQS